MTRRKAKRRSDDARTEARKPAVRLRAEGYTAQAIAAVLEVPPNTVYRWGSRERTGGEVALLVQKRGRRSAEQRRLSRVQESALQQTIRHEMPDALGLPFALWTGKAVQTWIARDTNVSLPIRTVGLYLKRWGLTPQKPIRKAYEQDPQAVDRWLRGEYPAIAARAEIEGAVIHWGDETGIEQQGQRERGYAPPGKTPVVRKPAKKLHLNLIASITNPGLVRFMVYEQPLTTKVLIGFLSRLIQSDPKKMFLILDKRRVHRRRAVRAWLSTRADRIEVFYLPAYSPELNPDELRNSDLKGVLQAGLPAETKTELKRKARTHLHRLQKRPDHIRRYFQHPTVAYAAALG